ncbi:anthranilate synthase component I [delta proteobacterium NaphS2]|nr:anthranilate synthase component I [delta proteobacterium NaphS2]
MEIKPSLSQFRQMTAKGNLIPVYKEFLADTETPVSAYLKIKDKNFSYLLESADGGSNWGRYSFIGYKPSLVVRYKNQKMEILRHGEIETLNDVQQPLNALRGLASQYRSVTSKDLPPFQGGLVGFFNYDLIRTWEPVPGSSLYEDMPECIFTASERLIIFDHLTHKITVVAHAHLQKDTAPESAYSKACDAVNETVCELEGHVPSAINENGLEISALTSTMEKEEFMAAVKKTKEYIVAGDAIQVVLSQRFEGHVSGEDFTLYRNLRSLNPSPYMFYLNFGDSRLIGASPEILVRLTDDLIELRPIAGTRPRGKNEKVDQALEKELMADPKERAEHIMLVDLGRNDAGKVAAPGTVTVPRLMEVERYSHVMHLVSRVEAHLSPEKDAFDLFMAAFPAGTVSGAPKIRAMEIIHELEPSPRGPYAGAVGYFGFNGNMDFCITIRTITLNKDSISLQVGAGIVADSDPKNEYQETLNKAGAMFQAIRRTQEG